MPYAVLISISIKLLIIIVKSRDGGNISPLKDVIFRSVQSWCSMPYTVLISIFVKLLIIIVKSRDGGNISPLKDFVARLGR
jgi:hypothetical protein